LGEKKDMSPKEKQLLLAQRTLSSSSRNIMDLDAQLSSLFDFSVMNDSHNFILREKKFVDLMIIQTMYPENNLKKIALENIHLLFSSS
jgi:hypothetical protein